MNTKHCEIDLDATVHLLKESANRLDVAKALLKSSLSKLTHDIKAPHNDLLIAGHELLSLADGEANGVLIYLKNIAEVQNSTAEKIGDIVKHLDVIATESEVK